MSAREGSGLYPLLHVHRPIVLSTFLSVQIFYLPKVANATNGTVTIGRDWVFTPAEPHTQTDTRTRSHARTKTIHTHERAHRKIRCALKMGAFPAAMPKSNTQRHVIPTLPCTSAWVGKYPGARFAPSPVPSPRSMHLY